MTASPVTYETLTGRLLGARRGVAAMEFALLMPLLCAMFAVAVEMGRYTMVRAQFEQAVASVARHVVRYPEYERKSREYAVPIAEALFPEGAANLSITVTSLNRSGGSMVEVFPTHTLFGTAPAIDWRTHVKTADYVENEAVVFIAGSYVYVPLFESIIGQTVTMTKTHTLLPHFSRTFVWNDSDSPDKYVWTAR